MTNTTARMKSREQAEARGCGRRRARGPAACPADGTDTTHTAIAKATNEEDVMTSEDSHRSRRGLLLSAGGFLVCRFSRLTIGRIAKTPRPVLRRPVQTRSPAVRGRSRRASSWALCPRASTTPDTTLAANPHLKLIFAYRLERPNRRRALCSRAVRGCDAQAALLSRALEKARSPITCCACAA
jgi:hypothetical protein